MKFASEGNQGNHEVLFQEILRKEKDRVVEYFTIIRNLIKILFFFINKWLSPPCCTFFIKLFSQLRQIKNLFLSSWIMYKDFRYWFTYHLI